MVVTGLADDAQIEMGIGRGKRLLIDCQRFIVTSKKSQRKSHVNPVSGVVRSGGGGTSEF